MQGRRIYTDINQKNSSMLCIGVKKIKIHFDTSQLAAGRFIFFISHLWKN